VGENVIIGMGKKDRRWIVTAVTQNKTKKAAKTHHIPSADPLPVDCWIYGATASIRWHGGSRRTPIHDRCKTKNFRRLEMGRHPKIEKERELWWDKRYIYGNYIDNEIETLTCRFRKAWDLVLRRPLWTTCCYLFFLFVFVCWLRGSKKKLGKLAWEIPKILVTAYL
jgi:hypothetical protein